MSGCPICLGRGLVKLNGVDVICGCQLGTHPSPRETPHPIPEDRLPKVPVAETGPKARK